MSIAAKLASFTAALSLTLPLAAPAQAFGGAPVVPQAISQHLEQQRLLEQLEQRERESAEAAHKDAAPVLPMPEASVGKAARPAAAKATKGIRKAQQPALVHSAQASK